MSKKIKEPEPATPATDEPGAAWCDRSRLLEILERCDLLRNYPLARAVEHLLRFGQHADPSDLRCASDLLSRELERLGELGA